MMMMMLKYCQFVLLVFIEYLNMEMQYDSSNEVNV